MWCTLDVFSVQRKLRTSINYGLTSKEANDRKQKLGPNKIQEGKKESFFIKFIKQFNDFMIITLIIAAVISAVISYIQNENDYIDSIIIIAIVVLNAIVGVIQESKAEKSIEALKKLTAPKAKVKRDGNFLNINPQINRQTKPSFFPTSSSLNCNGVCGDSFSIIIPAIFPTFVFIPVSVTIASACPDVTIVVANTIFFISPI